MFHPCVFSSTLFKMQLDQRDDDDEDEYSCLEDLLTVDQLQELNEIEAMGYQQKR